ncbi:MAG: orotate phosphoribosyltransferase [Ignavibacteriales bacterium]
MNENDVIQVFEDDGVIMRGHFLLTSGRHSSTFLQCSMVMQHPAHLSRLCAALAAKMKGLSPQCVAGPAMGGVILAYEMARALGARAIYAEKSAAEETGAGLAFRRGFGLSRGERCLVVEDAVTTGGSVRKLMELIRAAGAEVVGVAALVDRSGGRVVFGVPFASLLKLDVPSFEPGDCPLCRAGVPVERPKSAQGTPGNSPAN